MQEERRTQEINEMWYQFTSQFAQGNEEPEKAWEEERRDSVRGKKRQWENEQRSKEEELREHTLQLQLQEAEEANRIMRIEEWSKLQRLWQQ
jgi:hypothetical protein